MSKLMDKMGIKANRIALKAKKYAPEITLGVGIVSFVGTVILAGRQTLKAREVLDRHKSEMDEIHEAADRDEEYGNSDFPAQDKRGVYCRTVVGMTKTYAPVIGLGGLSIACILYSNSILKRRYLVAVSAYNAVSGAFNAYRERVRNEEGIEADRHYLFGTERKELVEEKVNEKGKKVEEKSTVEVAPDGNDNEFIRFFEEGATDYWDRDPGLNLLFLKSQETIWQNVLDTRGHVIFNEVLDALGFDMTQIGAITGWVKGNGDDYIDFGIRDYSNPAIRKFVNGEINVIPLEFNCDGIILDKI